MSPAQIQASGSAGMTAWVHMGCPGSSWMPVDLDRTCADIKTMGFRVHRYPGRGRSVRSAGGGVAVDEDASAARLEAGLGLALGPGLIWTWTTTVAPGLAVRATGGFPSDEGGVRGSRDMGLRGGGVRVRG